MNDQEKIKHYDYMKSVVDILGKYDRNHDFYINSDLLFESNMNDILERGGADCSIVEYGDIELEANKPEPKKSLLDMIICSIFS